MNDLVSIVVPVYKTEKYIERCVWSIRNQSYSNLEIILVDDGSPDSCGELCDSFAQEDKRIQVIHKKNGGLSSARNAGIDISRGDFICFIDSDDYISASYVETLLTLIKTTGSDFAKIDYVEVYSDLYTEPKIHLRQKRVYFDEDVERAFLELSVDSACVFLYSKSLIGDTRFPEGKTSEDIFQKAGSLVYLPVNLYYYYHNSSSISNGPLDLNMLNYLSFREEIYNFYKDKGLDAFVLLAESLYARAAMGLCVRMCFFGHSKDINEIDMQKYLSVVFNEHKSAFFKSKTIPFSRKVLAVLVFNFYSLFKLTRRFMR